MIDGLVELSGLPGIEEDPLMLNTSLMLTISPPLLESSSIRSSRVIGLLKMFLGPEIWTLNDSQRTFILLQTQVSGGRVGVPDNGLGNIRFLRPFRAPIAILLKHKIEEVHLLQKVVDSHPLIEIPFHDRGLTLKYS